MKNKNKLPYTTEKPRAVVNYKHQYGEENKTYPVKIYDNHIVMSREGFQEMLFASRQYYLLDDIYRTAGKLNNDGTSSIYSLYSSRPFGEY